MKLTAAIFSQLVGCMTQKHICSVSFFPRRIQLRAPVCCSIFPRDIGSVIRTRLAQLEKSILSSTKGKADEIVIEHHRRPTAEQDLVGG